MNIRFLILKNKVKLEQMINNDEKYDKILYQSRRLDKYIIQIFRKQNQINF